MCFYVYIKNKQARYNMCHTPSVSKLRLVNESKITCVFLSGEKMNFHKSLHLMIVKFYILPSIFSLIQCLPHSLGNEIEARHDAETFGQVTVEIMLYAMLFTVHLEEAAENSSLKTCLCTMSALYDIKNLYGLRTNVIWVVVKMCTCMVDFSCIFYALYSELSSSIYMHTHIVFLCSCVSVFSTDVNVADLT